MFFQCLRVFGVPPVSDPLQNVERSRHMDIDLTGGDMDGGKNRRKNITSTVDNCTGRLAASDIRDRKLPGEEGRSEPVVEISDKDYRSLHLPCDALEETGDSEQEG